MIRSAAPLHPCLPLTFCSPTLTLHPRPYLLVIWPGRRWPCTGRGGRERNVRLHAAPGRDRPARVRLQLRPFLKTFDLESPIPAFPPTAGLTLRLSVALWTETEIKINGRTVVPTVSDNSQPHRRGAHRRVHRRAHCQTDLWRHLDARATCCGTRPDRYPCLPPYQHSLTKYLH